MADASELNRCGRLKGENYAMMYSRLSLAFDIQNMSWRKELTPEELEQPFGVMRKTYTPGREALEQIYADTVAVYRPILAGFLVDIIRRTGAAADDMSTAIIGEIPRLVAALPDELCASAVAAAWNAAPFPLGVEGADARCGVWLYAHGGRMTGGRLYAVGEDGKAHPLATDKKPAPA